MTMNSDEWICPQCEQPSEMSTDDVDAPCQDCIEGQADMLYDLMKELCDQMKEEGWE